MSCNVFLIVTLIFSDPYSQSLAPHRTESPIPTGPPKPAEVIDYGHGAKDDKFDDRARRRSPERPLPRKK